MEPVLRPVPPRCAGDGTGGGRAQRQLGRSGRGDDRGGESRKGNVPGHAPSRAQREALPAQSGKESLDSQGRRETAALGRPDGEGPDRTGGVVAGVAADLRGRLRRRQLRVPPQAQRPRLPRCDPQGALAGPNRGDRRRPERLRSAFGSAETLIRHHRPCRLVAAGGPPRQRRQRAGVGETVPESSHRRGEGR